MNEISYELRGISIKNRASVNDLTQAQLYDEAKLVSLIQSRITPRFVKFTVDISDKLSHSVVNVKI